MRRTALRPILVAAALALVVPLAAPSIAGAASAPAPAWSRLTSVPETSAGSARTVRPDRAERWRLDRGAYAGSLATARSVGSGTVTLPTPDGGLARFVLTPTAVMAPGLAAAHPEISTFAGRGVDDPAATVRLDVGSLGLHASVRSAKGSWYVDPYYQRDRGVYLSYYGRDLRQNPHGTFVERDGNGLEEALAELGGATPDAAQPGAPSAGPRTGQVLRTYRLALVSDPSYAAFFGSENVTSAKVALMSRVDQVYEDDLSIRMVLIDGTDRLNLDTVAKASGANGPCGVAPCYTEASLQSCTIAAIIRNRTALGRLVGASAYDIGHLALGNSGGGVAGLGVVGGFNKAVGCTGIPQPVGDFYAVDYVAHEMGHQFGGNHTFNGVEVNCSGGNRNGATSVEPGSASSIMGYAGICGRDDLQPHSDPYFSQRSQVEVDRYVHRGKAPLDEVQTVALRQFSGVDSFALTFRGQRTRTITRGGNYTSSGIEAALKALPGFPAGGAVSVSTFGSSLGQPDDTGFQLQFGGSLGGIDLPALGVVAEQGTTGSVGETHQGGPVDNAGAITRTGNTPPVVTTSSRHVIPLRTPFALDGKGTDADGNPLVYLWEQDDPGAADGTALVDPVKRNGPLFRQFGAPLDTAVYDPAVFGSPGENIATGSSRRVFPNLPQILNNNTNAVSGDCPNAGAVGGPTDPVPQQLINCYSEFLPTAAYVGLGGPPALHFRLTARDLAAGGGGVASADTTLLLAKAAGPFLVTSQPGGQTYRAGSVQQLTWDVARTDVAPVGVSQVRITMSRDGGRTWPVVLATTANDGAAQFTVPAGDTNSARVRVEAVDNVFFAVNAGQFAVRG